MAREKNRKRPSNLREQVDPLMCEAYQAARAELQGFWPTPSATDVSDRAPGTVHLTRNGTVRHINPEGKQSFMRLSQVAKLWPTPRAFCHKDSVHDRGKGNLGEVIGGQLNPDWVEWLMGLPQGFTNVDCLVVPAPFISGWFDAEPQISRVLHGTVHRADRLESLGNMVLPYQFFPIAQAIAEMEAAPCNQF